MSFCTLRHLTLNATLKGETVRFNGVEVQHYRGIPYGTISRRFAKPSMVDHWNAQELDCTRFGPICPQNYVDSGHLLRYPDADDPHLGFEQDESKCLNLNVTVPVKLDRKDGELLPVFVWIHGGSGNVTFPPSAHRRADITPLVTHSVLSGTPIIIVKINYRLNIFAYGGTEPNLAIKDQRLGIDWIVNHIGGFGGDKNNLTLGGESFGAIYTHAQLCTGAPVRRGILQSGSLHLAPPALPEFKKEFIDKLAKQLEEESTNLAEAPVDVLLKLLWENNITCYWIDQEENLKGWETHDLSVDELIVGGMEYESNIIRNGIEQLSGAEIEACFTSSPTSLALLKPYHIHASRPNAAKLGALDFCHDYRYALPIELITERRAEAGKNTYIYLFDQVNPFQASARAHHGVDLVFLFGDHEFPRKGDRRLAEEMRTRWIAFINGFEPWMVGRWFAFGPFGKCGIVEEEEFRMRRRKEHIDLLRSLPTAPVEEALTKLTSGMVNLEN